MTESQRYLNNPSDRIMRKEIIVKATLGDVWNCWTTTEGVKTFFSPNAKVELYIGGPFEIYFLMDRSYGERGSEDCRFLSFLPMEMISFDWNAPSQFPEQRQARTIVIIRFQEIGSGEIKLDFAHHGWGTGEKWDEVYDYFDKAWTFVLNNFKKRCTDGPLSWDD